MDHIALEEKCPKCDWVDFSAPKSKRCSLSGSVPILPRTYDVQLRHEIQPILKNLISYYEKVSYSGIIRSLKG